MAILPPAARFRGPEIKVVLIPKISVSIAADSEIPACPGRAGFIGH